jgi:predicted nucleotidyltransferase
MRRPKDRDFLETTEGLLFCVVGYLHPPGRYVAYLKYTPADTGKWARGDVAYRRELPYYHVRHVRRTLEWLEAEHPRYLWTDPATGLRFSHVPAGPCFATTSRSSARGSSPARRTRSAQGGT